MVKSHEMERSHEISHQYMPMLLLLGQKRVSLNYFVDLFKVISGTSFNSSWHLLKISPNLIIPGTSFTYIGYLLKLLAPLAKVGAFYFVFVSWVGGNLEWDLGGTSGGGVGVQ